MLCIVQTCAVSSYFSRSNTSPAAGLFLSLLPHLPHLSASLSISLPAFLSPSLSPSLSLSLPSFLSLWSLSLPPSSLSPSLSLRVSLPASLSLFFYLPASLPPSLSLLFYLPSCLPPSVSLPNTREVRLVCWAGVFCQAEEEFCVLISFA